RLKTLTRAAEAGTGPGARTVYAYAGLKTTRTDPTGRVHNVTVDQGGKLVTEGDVIPASSSAPAREILTTYQYWPFGRVKSRSGPSGTTQFTWDIRGRRATTDDDDSGHEATTFDAFGGLVQTTSGIDNVVTYRRDVLGRVYQATDRTGTQLYVWDTGAGAGI